MLECGTQHQADSVKKLFSIMSKNIKCCEFTNSYISLFDHVIIFYLMVVEKVVVCTLQALDDSDDSD